MKISALQIFKAVGFLTPIVFTGAMIVAALHKNKEDIQEPQAKEVVKIPAASIGLNPGAGYRWFE